jgi:dephospho-CoA kinase
MLVLGLTGSAAMGKSTVAKMFAEAGAAVFDADRVVHDLYAGEAAAAVEAAFPGTTKAGEVDRQTLRARVIGDDAAMARLEAMIHPLVLAREAAFRAGAAAAGRRIILLDIPLLFETRSEGRADVVLVVSAPAAVQQARLSARGLGAADIAAMLSRQLPDEEKRRRAHFVIDTAGPIDATHRQVRSVMRAVAGLAGG